jgi:CMP-N,N'-diacetyllegionaminic acid synthase
LKILAVIPARGGSKGIPRKNIRTLAGKPLIAWTIEAALQVKRINRVIISTEDAQIAAVATKFGAEVPFMRPLELTEDDTPGIAPVLHAIQQIPDHNWILLLQPTSPLRSVEDIQGIIQLCEDEGAPSAVSVTEVSKHPLWMFRRDDQKRLHSLIPNGLEVLRRQDLPSYYALNGALYLARTDWLIENQRFLGPETLGYVMPGERSVDIDTPVDWLWAEYLIERAYE